MSMTPSSEHDQPLKVGYILKMFPRLSETFILNEILELERQGVEVEVFSLMAPGDGRFHGSLSELKLTIEYVLREKPESYWDKISNFPPGIVPSMERWQLAVDFLREHSIPKELDMLLRAVYIGAEARTRGVQHFHAHFATISTRMAALVNLLYDIPFSFTCHAKDIFRETVNRNLFRELTDHSAFAITVSDFNRQYILDHTPGIDAAKVISDEGLAAVILLSAFSQQDLIKEASNAGVLAYLVKPFQRSDLVPSIELALGRFEEISGLKQEAVMLRESLETRKLVDRAKGLLIDNYGLKESDAYRYLQKKAMEDRTTMKAVAEDILADTSRVDSGSFEKVDKKL